MLKNRDPRGWIYVGLVALGMILVLTGAVKANNLLEWFLTIGMAASALGNLLARAFLEKKPSDPDSE